MHALAAQAVGAEGLASVHLRPSDNPGAPGCDRTVVARGTPIRALREGDVLYVRTLEGEAAQLAAALDEAAFRARHPRDAHALRDGRSPAAERMQQARNGAAAMERQQPPPQPQQEQQQQQQQQQMPMQQHPQPQLQQPGARRAAGAPSRSTQRKRAKRLKKRLEKLEAMKATEDASPQSADARAATVAAALAREASTPAPALAVHEGGKQISALDSAVRSYTHQVVAEVAAATPVTVQGEGTTLGANALAFEPNREAALPRAQVCATAFAVAVTPGSPWDAFAENVAKPLSAARAAAMLASQSIDSVVGATTSVDTDGPSTSRPWWPRLSELRSTDAERFDSSPCVHAEEGVAPPQTVAAPAPKTKTARKQPGKRRFKGPTGVAGLLKRLRSPDAR